MNTLPSSITHRPSPTSHHLALIIVLMLAFTTAIAKAQSLHSEATDRLTDGILNLDLGGKANKVRIGGFVAANGHLTEVKNDNNDNGFNVEHAYFSIEGSFLGEKLGFFLQTDFTLSYPLLDAYATYQPVKNLVFAVGQKQTFTNTREMMLRDELTAFGGQHSAMSQAFCETGRELGIYAEYRVPSQSVGLDMGVAVTSGDGRNSFGSSSIDSDCGGLKYGGRATVYPLGYFKRGNELVFHDFVREEHPRLAIGVAFSYNDGASHAKGEGHGDFTMYDADGQSAWPDYRRLAADIMLKWQGFTLLADWQNTTATHLDDLSTAASTSTRLVPEQIADYLALGNGVDVQAGYLFKSLWAIDAGWSWINPEFREHENSALSKQVSIDLGLSKYFCNNAIKVQLHGNYTKYRTEFMQPYKNRSVRVSAQVMF